MNNRADIFDKALSPREFEEELKKLENETPKKTLRMIAAASERILRDLEEDYVAVHSA